MYFVLCFLYFVLIRASCHVPPFFVVLLHLVMFRRFLSSFCILSFSAVFCRPSASCHVPPVLRIRDVYPGSRIQNQQQKREVKKINVKPFNIATKFNKIVNYFCFELLKKKIWANFQWIIKLFTKKIIKKLFKIWSWDPGSGIRDPGSGKKPIPDPGSRGQKGTGSRIRNTGSCPLSSFCILSCPRPLSSFCILSCPRPLSSFCILSCHLVLSSFFIFVKVIVENYFRKNTWKLTKHLFHCL
jgi:hypothetical protein